MKIFPDSWDRQRRVGVTIIAAAVLAFVTLSLLTDRLDSVFDSLNANAGAWQAVFAAVVGVSTVVTVMLTRQLVDETVKLREAETHPDVALYFELPPYSHLLLIVVHNVGRGAAYDVTFELDYLVKRPDGEQLAFLSFFKGLKYLAPGQSMRISLGPGWQVLDEDEPVPPIPVNVKYRDRAGTPFTEQFVLDPRIFAGHHAPTTRPEQQIVKQLQEISRAIGKLGTTRR